MKSQNKNYIWVIAISAICVAIFLTISYLVFSGRLNFENLVHNESTENTSTTNSNNVTPTPIPTPSTSVTTVENSNDYYSADYDLKIKSIDGWVLSTSKFTDDCGSSYSGNYYNSQNCAVGQSILIEKISKTG